MEGECLEQREPGWEQGKGGQLAQSREEPYPRSGAGLGLLPEVFGHLGHGVKGEGEQVEGRQEGSEIVFAVPENCVRDYSPLS